MPFDIDTGLENPIDVDLGTVSIPLIGDVEVQAEFYYDLTQRQICVTLSLAGLIAIAKTCANFCLKDELMGDAGTRRPGSCE